MELPPLLGEREVEVHPQRFLADPPMLHYEASLDHRLREGVLLPGLRPRRPGPYHVDGVEHAYQHHLPLLRFRTRPHEVREDVALLAIDLRGAGDLLRFAETRPLPREGPLDDPGQNAGRLLAKFRRELAVARLLRDRDGEGDVPDPTPNGLLDTTDLRFMIGGEEELELRHIREELSEQEPRRNAVASASLLNQRLVEPLRRVGLNRGDHPEPDERREVIADPVTTIPIEERAKLRRLAVILTEHEQYGFKERGLAVGARAIQEEEHLLARVACRSVAEHALEVGYEARVAVHDLLQEREPLGRSGLGIIRHRRESRDKVLTVMRPQHSSPQVKRTVQHVQQERVPIQLLLANRVD